MILATTRTGSLTTPRPGAQATCPCCQGPVIAKCGSINVWHWAHESSDCDPWSEPESRWHKAWKEEFPLQYQEVIIGPHRADVSLPALVIEIQASIISADEIIERERFYGNLAWIVRADEIDTICFRDHGTYSTFRWKYPRKCWWSATMPIYLDCGEFYEIFAVTRLYAGTPCGGYGQFLSREQLVNRLKGAGGLN